MPLGELLGRLPGQAFELDLALQLAEPTLGVVKAYQHHALFVALHDRRAAVAGGVQHIIDASLIAAPRRQLGFRIVFELTEYTLDVLATEHQAGHRRNALT